MAFAVYHLPADPQQTRHRADTVIKAATVLDSTRQKTLAETVKIMVEDNVRGNCHTADTDEFLDSILPLPDEWIEKVYQQLLRDGVYTQESWRDLPKDEKREDGLYVSFANIANAINKACSTNGLPIGVESYWLDRHSISPRSRDKYAAAIRPDVVSVLGKTEVLDEWEKTMTSLKESISKKDETDNKKDDTKSKNKDKKLEEIQKKVCCCMLPITYSLWIASPLEDSRIGEDARNMVAPCTHSCRDQNG